jgi:GNAT superfamily N-acetyltransferase
MSFQNPYAAQVPLPFFGPYGDPQSFELYFPGANREAYQCLLELCDTAGPLSLYLWGGPGSGKSHLLQATCQRFYERGRQAAYLPLSQIPEWSPAVLEGLESLDLVGLDEIDCLAGRSGGLDQQAPLEGCPGDLRRGLGHGRHQALDESAAAHLVDAVVAGAVDLPDTATRDEVTRRMHTDEPREYSGELNKIYLLRDFQGRGLGRQLLHRQRNDSWPAACRRCSCPATQ